MERELEKAIDEVGRESVFQRARDMGWTEDTPPAWLWWVIVKKLRNERAAAAVLMTDL